MAAIAWIYDDGGRNWHYQESMQESHSHLGLQTRASNWKLPSGMLLPIASDVGILSMMKRLLPIASIDLGILLSLMKWPLLLL
jgi:hypothetical protein